MTTKRQIPSLVSSLVKGCDDPVAKVKTAFTDSLVDIGKNEPALVLSKCKGHLSTTKLKEGAKDKPLAQSHRVALLGVMQRVCELKLPDIEESLGLELIACALAEMTAEKIEVIPDWQGKASLLLVSLGMRFAKKIVANLLDLFGPGVVPHYFVMKTLADLSVANPVHMVPLMSDVMARMLPVLASVKQDNIRWVFGSAIGHFCEAIISYKANVDVLEVDVATFAPQIFAAYELINQHWLISKNPKVRLVTITAIGSCCTIMATNQFESQLPKLVPVFNNMYKKEAPSDHLAITQGYCSLLGAATREESLPIVEPLLDMILQTLFPLICNPIDFSEPGALKNHNEMLRSVEICAKVFTDSVLTFLFLRLQKGDAKVRNGVLLVLKHLVTRNQAQLEEHRKGLLLSSLKPLVDNEQDLQCKKSLAQVIISMANESYLSLEGGEPMVEFIILNSSITDAEIKAWQAAHKGNKNPGVSPSELRMMCDNILSLMTTTIPQMVDVLWPYLLEPLTKPKFNSSMAVVAKCISHISKVKRESQASSYMINFDTNVNLPKPAEIIARLFVLCNLPSRRGNLALHLLTTLQYIGPILHPEAAKYWDNMIPKLLGILQSEGFASSSSDENDSKWEGYVRRLLSETLKQIGDDSWTMQIGDAIVAQFPFHKNDPPVKRCALKLLGVILQSTNKKDYIKTNLETMFKSIDHSIEEERIGVSQGFGYAASTHLDIVLGQQTDLMKSQAPAKKEEESSGGFFSSLFGSSKEAPKKSGGASGSQLNTCILSYGYIVAYAKPQLVTTRLDMHVIASIQPHLKTTSTPLQLTLIKAFDLIGQSLHQDHLQGAPYIFKHRDEFLRELLRYINLNPPPPVKKDEKTKEMAPIVNKVDIKPFTLTNTKAKTSVLGLNACATLIRLSPPLARDLEETVTAIVLQFTTAEKDEKTEEGAEEIGIPLIIENLDACLMTVLSMDKSVACLKRLLHANHAHRKRAMSTYVRLLKKYIDLVSETLKSNVKPTDREVEGIGHNLAVLLPRICDPEPDVRGHATESIQLLLYIHWLLQKILTEDPKIPVSEIDLRPPKTLNPFTGLRKRMVALEDQNEQFSHAHQMSTLIAGLVSDLEFPNLCLTGLNGLLDSQTPSARGCCVILFGLITQRGKDLEKHVVPFVSGLIEKMKGIKNEQTTNGSIVTLRTMASVHLLGTIDALLAQPIPHEPHVARVTQMLARDAELCLPVLKALAEVLNNGEIMEDVEVQPKAGPDGKKPANPGPPKVVSMPSKDSQGATVCLSEMLQDEELKEIAVQHFSMFFGTLLLRSAVTAGFPESAEQTNVAWKSFFKALQEEEIVEKLDETGTWSKVTQPGAPLIEAVASLTSIVARRHISEMDKIFEQLLPFLKSNFPAQRSATGFCFAELVSHTKENHALLDKLVMYLLNSLVDPLLKIPAVRGLGNISVCPADMVHKYATTVLDALMSAIDDKLDDVVLEAMNGLAKVFRVVDESRMHAIIINIFHRIRPAFDNPNDAIRSSAAILFESLARFGEGISKAAIYEQIHNNLPCVVVHMNDENPEVKKSFRRALAAIGPLMHSPEITNILSQKHIFSVENEPDFSDFVHMHLSKALIKSFPDRLNGYIQTAINPYFTSQWSIVQGNAAYFVGCVLGHLPDDIKKSSGINAGHTAKAMIGLLSSTSPIVREKAAEAIAMMSSY